MESTRASRAVEVTDVGQVALHRVLVVSVGNAADEVDSAVRVATRDPGACHLPDDGRVKPWTDASGKGFGVEAVSGLERGIDKVFHPHPGLGAVVFALCFRRRASLFVS